MSDCAHVEESTGVYFILWIYLSMWMQTLVSMWLVVFMCIWFVYFTHTYICTYISIYAHQTERDMFVHLKCLGIWVVVWTLSLISSLRPRNEYLEFQVDRFGFQKRMNLWGNIINMHYYLWFPYVQQCPNVDQPPFFM